MPKAASHTYIMCVPMLLPCHTFSKPTFAKTISLKKTPFQKAGKLTSESNIGF